MVLLNHLEKTATKNYRMLLFKNRESQVFLVKKLKNLVYEIFNNDYILVSASINPFFKNWGDDVSLVLAQLIRPDLKIINAGYSFNIRRRKEYLCIGSIITWLTKPNTIIWGSGVQFPTDEILFDDKPIKPLKVCAVRGPLTRKYLLDKGIECPEIYGDPALLFPKFYTPPKQKKYKYGILPHFKDKKSTLVKKLLERGDTHFIDIQDSDDWRTLINEINSCEFVLSSTLHGIIIADSYNVPNIWVEFEVPNLKRFTFQDYFYSVNKNIDKPTPISEKITDTDLEGLKRLWQPPQIDVEPLLKACPFLDI